MNKPVLVLGAGGHASVVVDILRQLKCTILGIVATDSSKNDPVFSGLTRYSDDNKILSFDKDDILLVNAIGSLPGHEARFKLHSKYKKLGYSFMTVISPTAIVSDYARMAEGVHVMAGSVINANASIGECSIINTAAVVEHDCKIGQFNHIAPGAVLSGGVTTGSNVHIGTGARVIQGIDIGMCAVVGAGATVTRDLEGGKTLYVAKSFTN